MDEQFYTLVRMLDGMLSGILESAVKDASMATSDIELATRRAMYAIGIEHWYVTMMIDSSRYNTIREAVRAACEQQIARDDNT